MTVNPPTVSLVMVTYKRDAAVVRQLEMLRPYRDAFHEVIIVDNGCSADLSVALTAIWDGPLTLLPQRENLGAVGRSIGILASTGDIVLTLDDDVRLAHPEELAQLVAFFSVGARVGCVNFKILYGDGVTLDLSDWCHPRDPTVYANSLFETTYISEGACALDGPLVRRLAAYPLDLFIGQEGVDLAARIFDQGFGIYYLPSVSVLHAVATEGRATGRQFYFNTRNIYWIALRLYPVGLASRTIFREWVTLLFMALFRRRVGFFLKGCRDAIARTPTLLRERRPIGASAALRIRELNRLKLSPWRRLSRVAASKTLD